jgi:multiple sugar transport system ATP-binding protein
VKEAADILDIGHLLDRKPKQLSGGQRQRVAVGRAIVREPAVFLFDEPLSNLDAKLRVQTRSQLTRLHQRLATTFIYVTHDQVEAMTMASRIAVMKDGVLQQIDTPQHLYDHPNNVFVAGFIGSPSMNFFDATLVESDGKLEINAGGFRLEVPAAKANEWRQYKGREVIFGIRPEDIHAKPFTPPGILESDVMARVDVTELMGNEIFLYLMTKDNKQFIARVDPRVQTHPGEDIDLAINMSNAHIFDPKTEVSLAG